MVLIPYATPPATAAAMIVDKLDRYGKLVADAHRRQRPERIARDRAIGAVTEIAKVLNTDSTVKTRLEPSGKNDSVTWNGHVEWLGNAKVGVKSRAMGWAGAGEESRWRTVTVVIEASLDTDESISALLQAVSRARPNPEPPGGS
ncbi:hypothetical protein V5P93_002345 [Actinokineospora auranticolor]|uniref:Uncharacterized protein n=2 Tax=Actinokineospora auranticolor TaxID=155976 RepID=A0A2S6GE67_9PSEU|nr:hypothetical protein CLV40_12989 [Actinokineospora auranticolor]